MRILFVFQALSSFVEKDLRILREAHEVREYHFRGVRDTPGLVRGVLWCDISFSWFGKLHAFLAVLFSRLLGKKSVVVAGGDDVAKVPELDYGLFCSWWKKYCPLLVFRFADLILCVSEANEAETLVNAKADAKKVRVLRHGFDGELFKKAQDVEKEDIILTVGRVTQETLRRKGLELFVRSAGLLPSRRFFLVGFQAGRAIEELRRERPENVNFTDEICRNDLIDLYSRAKVYVQASMHEGFGCSVAEAMLCECVPVVSRRGALPEVVGDCGFYINELDPKELATTTEEALLSDMGKRARERVLARFSLDERRRGLLEAIDSVR